MSFLQNASGSRNRGRSKSTRRRELETKQNNKSRTLSEQQETVKGRRELETTQNIKGRTLSEQQETVKDRKTCIQLIEVLYSSQDIRRRKLRELETKQNKGRT